MSSLVSTYVNVPTELLNTCIPIFILFYFIVLSFFSFLFFFLTNKKRRILHKKRYKKVLKKSKKSNLTQQMKNKPNKEKLSAQVKTHMIVSRWFYAYDKHINVK